MNVVLKRNEDERLVRFPRVRLLARRRPTGSPSSGPDVAKISPRGRGVEIEPRARLHENAIDAIELLERMSELVELHLAAREVQIRKA